jgi:predicted  nucleic acid-binding Zn-ribbon protein
MSGIEQELLSEEVDVKEVVLLPRTMSNLEEEVLALQAFFKEEITQRDQIIVENETERDKLNSKLDDGLLLIRNELETP